MRYVGRSKVFTYDYGEGKIVELPAKPPFEHCSASGAKVHDGRHPEARLRYREEFADRGMSLEDARLALGHYLANGIDVNAIPTREKQNVLTRPASTIVSAAMTDVADPFERSPESPVVPRDERDWTMGDLVDGEDGERVGFKRSLPRLPKIMPR